MLSTIYCPVAYSPFGQIGYACPLFPILPNKIGHDRFIKTMHIFFESDMQFDTAIDKFVETRSDDAFDRG